MSGEDLRRTEFRLITDELIAQLIESAQKSPRRRINYNFHSSAEDNPHRFLNVFLKGSYVQPHRHLRPPKAESFLVLRGQMAAFIFDDNGRVISRNALGSGEGGALGIDIAPGVWHTVTSVTPEAVCYEVKPGPWDPATDKEMATWAPGEGSPEAAEYLNTLLTA